MLSVFACIRGSRCGKGTPALGLAPSHSGRSPDHAGAGLGGLSGDSGRSDNLERKGSSSSDGVLLLACVVVVDGVMGVEGAIGSRCVVVNYDFCVGMPGKGLFVSITNGWEAWVGGEGWPSRD